MNFPDEGRGHIYQLFSIDCKTFKKNQQETSLIVISSIDWRIRQMQKLAFQNKSKLNIEYGFSCVKGERFIL